MEYHHDESFHDSLRAHFQTVDVVRLNIALVDAGVHDEKVRRDVLESYFFGAGCFFDNGWFEADSRRFAPGVYFEEVDGSHRTGRFYLPGPNLGTLFHEFVHGTVDLLFNDDNENALDVNIGEIGE
jgi:hypothetical protein